MIDTDDHDPNATTDELRSIIAELQAELDELKRDAEDCGP